MCERKRIISYPIVRHQQPTRQSHIQPGLRVADCGVRCLNAKCLRELQQRVAKRGASLERLAQFGGWHALAGSGRLNVGRMRRAVIAEHDRQAPSCPRGQSTRLRPACRWIERRQRMRIPLRGNTRRRSACWVFQETFVSRGSRIRDAAQANRSRRSKGIRAICCCCASRASSPFRRERTALSAIDACRLEPRSMMPL